jgi:hypothetical protein
MRWTCLALVTALVACGGGQPPRTKEQSEALGDQSRDVPAATRQEKDWKAAARGHGAAGPISSSDHAQWDKESLPDASVPADAGVRR